MTFNEIRDSVLENYYKLIGFSKENSYSMKHQKKKYLQLFAIKLTEKIPHPRNAKQHFQSFIRKKNTKSVKQSKIITQHQDVKTHTLLIQNQLL